MNWLSYLPPLLEGAWVTAQLTFYSTLLGGFFGRHFLYDSACPYPQAIALSKAVGRPVKLIWSREEEFLRDVLRPVAAVNFRAALDNDGWPLAIEAISATEGAAEAIAGKQGEKLDPTALGGSSGKSYSLTASSNLIELGRPGLEPFLGFIQWDQGKDSTCKRVGVSNSIFV